MPRAGYGELTAGAETSATQALHPPGAEAAPGTSFTTDPNTGIYLNAADTMGLVVNATDQVLITDGGFQFQKTSTVSTSTGTLSISSPTITSPTIGATAWGSATHTHAGSSTGGQIALSSATGTLAVSAGGTGATSLTDGGILLGSGTSAVTAMGVLADGEIVVGDGSTDPVALAAFSSSTGTLKVANGGAGASSLADKAVLITQDSGTDTVAAAAMTTSGNILVGGSSGPAVTTLTAGTGITVANGDGSISVTAGKVFSFFMA